MGKVHPVGIALAPPGWERLRASFPQAKVPMLVTVYNTSCVVGWSCSSWRLQIHPGVCHLPELAFLLRKTSSVSMLQLPCSVPRRGRSWWSLQWPPKEPHKCWGQGKAKMSESVSSPPWRTDTSTLPSANKRGQAQKCFSKWALPWPGLPPAPPTGLAFFFEQQHEAVCRGPVSVFNHPSSYWRQKELRAAMPHQPRWLLTEDPSRQAPKALVAMWRAGATAPRQSGPLLPCPRGSMHFPLSALGAPCRTGKEGSDSTWRFPVLLLVAARGNQEKLKCP